MLPVICFAIRRCSLPPLPTRRRMGGDPGPSDWTSRAPRGGRLASNFSISPELFPPPLLPPLFNFSPFSLFPPFPPFFFQFFILRGGKVLGASEAAKRASGEGHVGRRVARATVGWASASESGAESAICILLFAAAAKLSTARPGSRGGVGGDWNPRSGPSLIRKGYESRRRRGGQASSVGGVRRQCDSRSGYPDSSGVFSVSE